jgi:hypothetical protein
MKDIDCRVCVERRRRDGKGGISKAVVRVRFQNQIAYLCSVHKLEIEQIHRKGVKEGIKIAKKAAKTKE